MSERLQLSTVDPELASLVAGTAPAELELQVLTGELADALPSEAERARAAREAAIAELVGQGNPWGGTDAAGMNITRQLRLQQLDQERAARLQSEALTAAPPPAEPTLHEQRAAEVAARQQAAAGLANALRQERARAGKLPFQP